MSAQLKAGAPALTPQAFPVVRSMRAERLRQKPCVLWFTGLSGAGKSTLSGLVEASLFKRGYLTYVLDGDNVRHGLCNDLDFSYQARIENIRRVGEVSKLFVDAGLIVLTAFISPFARDRALVRELIGEDQFVEIFVNASLSVCEARDPKGLYRKARNGSLPHFTGVDSPYEAPQLPDIALDTSTMPAAECAQKIVDYLHQGGWLLSGAVARPHEHS
ncbi:adenylyl-sulfate kinase [Massilia cavernae]|uniref:Adenylyl-sulfate kinase n=1 Tax=Massilia cavernae TaxID=2320864 RepID=A0A418XRF6_9BURK|nr:adenylyl-sulfate kinase [Massilia cavernae]RJG15053.1 adenylyl-sulfate kinase [Massilia cavernae]